MLSDISNKVSSLINVLKDTIEKTSKDTQNTIKEQEELTRKAINEKLGIAEEILNFLLKSPEQFKDKHVRKIFMLARYPEFIKPLQALLDKGFIEECSYYYNWKEKNKESNKSQRPPA